MTINDFKWRDRNGKYKQTDWGKMLLFSRIPKPFHKLSKYNINLIYLFNKRTISFSTPILSSKTGLKECEFLTVCDKKYARDEFTNVTPHILSFLPRNLQFIKNHPLYLIKQRIIRYMYGSFLNRRGNPLFSVYDHLSPVVSVQQNFDSLLVPKDHVCRNKSDSYYINSEYLLRPHTSAHQNELIKSGLDHFLVFGDVYRRDEIDSKHYPVFHQCEAVRLLSSHEV